MVGVVATLWRLVCFDPVVVIPRHDGDQRIYSRCNMITSVVFFECDNSYPVQKIATT